MSSEEKMEMLTKPYKTVSNLWNKYKSSWTSESCKIRDAVIIILALLLIIL